MREIRRQSLNGGDVLARDRANGRNTGPHSVAVHVHGARAAQGHAAAELRARQAELFAQRPQKRNRGINIQFSWFTIDNKTSGCHAYHPPEARRTVSLIRLVRYEPNCRASMTETLEDVTDRPYSLFPYLPRVEHLLCLSTQNTKVRMCWRTSWTPSSCEAVFSAAASFLLRGRWALARGSSRIST